MPLTYKETTPKEDILEIKERLREIREDMRIMGDFLRLIMKEGGLFEVNEEEVAEVEATQ